MNNYFFTALFVFLSCCCFFACGDESFEQGKNLYSFHCQNCHMEDGTGLRGDIPPLAQSDYLKNNQDKLACIIIHGQTDSIHVNGQLYTTPMPGVKSLSEFQIANIVNYINHAWGNDFGFRTVEELKAQVADCP